MPENWNKNFQGEPNKTFCFNITEMKHFWVKTKLLFDSLKNFKNVIFGSMTKLSIFFKIASELKKSIIYPARINCGAYN